MNVRSTPAYSPDMLVSVVVPCFNGARYLRATIDSVLCQTHERLELIVVDDCSTDDSPAIVETLAAGEARVRLLRLERNHGTPGGPRNAGVRAARGDWVAFLDADDLWHPRKLELQMRVLAEQGATMCSTQMLDFRDESAIRRAEVPDPLPIVRVTLTQQLLKYRTPTSSIVIRRALMLEHPFNESIAYRAREDTDCFIRAHEYMPHSLKIVVPLVHYRLQVAQISGNKWKMVDRHLSMLRSYRLRSGAALGWKAYWFTATHFVASIWIRMIRRTL
jgi:teichuronic acid biosynthesis glycosyltransferase TuaG